MSNSIFPLTSLIIKCEESEGDMAYLCSLLKQVYVNSLIKCNKPKPILGIKVIAHLQTV